MVQAIVRLMTRRDSIGCRRRRIQAFRVAAVCVSVEATSYQGVGRHVPLADERVTLKDLDASRPPQHGGEQGRVIGAGRSCERRVQRQESRVGGITVPTFNVSHRGAIVERFDGEESRDLFAVFVNVLQQ